MSDVFFWMSVSMALTIIVGAGFLIYKDLTRRGVDPTIPIILMYFLWPVGLYVWMRRRRENPLPDANRRGR